MATDYVDDDFIYDTQWLAMKRAIQGNGILSGMAVTPNATQPPLEVDIASGVFYAGLQKRTFPGGSQVINTAHATFDRWDVLTGTTSGSPIVRYIPGTAAAAPKPPDLPSNEVLIAAIYVPATITQILASHIRDFGFWSSLLEHASRHLPDGSDGLAVGAPSDIGTSNQEGNANAFVRQNHIHKHPSGLGADLHHSRQHAMGAAADHTSATLAQLNALVSDATLIDTTDSRLSDARTPTVHDHTKHTDRTRKIFFDTWNALLRSPDPNYDPSRVEVTLNGDTYHGREFLAATLSGRIRGAAPVPIGYISAASNVTKIAYVADNAGAGNAVFQFNIYAFKDGEFSDFQGGVSTFAVVQHSGNGVKVQTITSTSIDFTSYDSIHMSIWRRGADGGDTFTGKIYVLGAWIEYTADQ